jgi:class 3 adenylate cyclase/DNA-binding CsgD family transcriptional regulator/tetratricopeptide (TPR) repeat protein
MVVEMADGTATAATFLFTDIEGSTQLLKRLRDRYGAVLAQHQHLLREAFAAYGGQEVDTQGDAFFVAFPRARDAVQAAIAAQRALAAHEWPEGEELRVRIGVHTGEAAVAANRYVGLSVHRAARICALGRGGQILVSQTTRHVIEDDEEPLPGIELRELGERRLKDLAQPVRLSEVVFELERGPAPAPEDARLVRAQDERIVLPGPLGLASAFPFVGRTAELESLASLLPLGEYDGRRVALVGGEPGSGKTRLVRELAHEAAARGVLVLYGTSDAVVNSPYKPFVEALDFLVRVLDADVARGALGTAGGELTRLLPDLAARLGPFPAPARADPETERHRLHTAVGDLLLHVGRRQPVLLVVDDAHWADAPTLHLIRHLARAGDVRMLLLATFRDRDPESSPEFSDSLADLSRIEGVTRLRLAGLEGTDVEEFVRRTSGAPEAVEFQEVARSLEGLTEGNPFLLCELWRTLVESSAIEVSHASIRLGRPVAELTSPESVRDVVRYRLSRLASSTTALLEVAAIVGAEFELAMLREATALDANTLYGALDEAVGAGTIEEVPGPGLAHRFTHELVRRALADGLTGLRRAELHLRVAEALERVHPTVPARVLPDLAHHFTLAAAVAGAERAVRYNVRAAEAATGALAFEDAAARLSTALEIGVEDDAERARLELERGTAHSRAGQTPEALEAFASAAQSARSGGDAETLARAALGYEDASNQPMLTDEKAVALLREALLAIGADRSALRARLLSALSRALVFVGEEQEAAELRVEATAMARELGDPTTLARLLIQEEIRNVRVPLADALERLTQARDLALELGDRDVLLEAMWRRVATLAALGELHEARKECNTLRRGAEEARQPLWRNGAALFGSAFALCDGKLDEAEALAEEAEEWTRSMSLPTSAPTSGEYGVQLFGIRREQGRLDELRPIVELLAGSPDKAEAWRPGLVALLVEIGMEDAARAELERMRADAFWSVTGALGTAALVYLTDACAALRDVESAAHLYPRLEPLAARTIVIGQLVACYGAADRYLGMLGAVLSDWDTAEAHFEYGLYLNRRTAAHTWTAHTAYQYARMLLMRGRAIDRPRAAELLAEAAAACARLGLVALASKVEALRTTGPPPAALPDGLSTREVDVLRLVAQGHSNREIGKRLFISEHTAANHVRSILRKTGCANRTDAASYAHQRGLVGER